MNKKQYKKEAIRLLEENLSKHIGNTNLVSKSQVNHFRNLPKRLYKYCSINNHSLQNINNKQLYISPINKLDDQFELMLSRYDDLDDYFSDTKALLKNRFKNYDTVISRFSDDELKNVFHGKNIEEIAKKDEKLKILPELFNKINNDSKFEKNIVDLINLFANVREEYGVCSLSEKKPVSGFPLPSYRRFFQDCI